MNIYYYDNFGYFTGTGTAVPDGQGGFIVPEKATILEPPAVQPIERAVFSDGAWEVDSELWPAEVRSRRDALLAASDFRMVSDAPWDTAPWLAYRQALRDLPQQPGFPWTPGNVAWPTPPQ